MEARGRISSISKCILRAILILAMAVILLGGIFGYHARPVNVPAVQNGILDLRDWDFERNGEVGLNGDWEFYWEQLLTPADFAKAGGPAHRMTGTIRVPDSWQGFESAGEELTGEGYATYRVLLLLPDKCPHMAFYIPQLYTAYKLWANGTLIASAGRVGRSRGAMTPQYIHRVVPYRPTGKRLELVVQISNFHHRRGGIWRSVRLGLYGRIMQENNLQKAFGLLIMGSFLLMAIYNLSLYFAFRQGPAPLLLSIFFWIGFIRLALVGQVLYSQVFPNFDWELAMKLEYFTFYFCGPVFYWMIRCLYPAEIPRLFIRIAGCAALVFAGFTILTPARIYTHLAPVYQLILLGGVTYMAVVLGRVSAKRREYLMISVFAVIFLSLFNDVLFYHKLVGAEFPIIPIIERLKNVPFWSGKIPAGLISMAFFIFIFNLLTLKMTRHYFSGSGHATEPEIAAAALNGYGLSSRESELILYLIQGYSNKEIAAKLSITEGTVKVHLHNIYQKTGVGNRTELSHLMQRRADAEDGTAVRFPAG